MPETQAKDLQVGQKGSIDMRTALARAHVSRIDPAAHSGTVLEDLASDDALPAGTRPDLNVEGTIDIERLTDTLFIGRPALAQTGLTMSLFKLDAAGDGATRTTVQLGAASVKHIQVRGGLREGDRVILSDMSQWDRVDAIHLD